MNIMVLTPKIGTVVEGQTCVSALVAGEHTGSHSGYPRRRYLPSPPLQRPDTPFTLDAPLELVHAPAPRVVFAENR